jgi:hypothetical protein
VFLFYLFVHGHPLEGTVEPGRRRAARAMAIDFGPATGPILGIQTAGTPRSYAPAGKGNGERASGQL